jgi:hypothetical protein
MGAFINLRTSCIEQPMARRHHNAQSDYFNFAFFIG